MARMDPSAREEHLERAGELLQLADNVECSARREGWEPIGSEIISALATLAVAHTTIAEALR
jgi:hypothetical protein